MLSHPNSAFDQLGKMSKRHLEKSNSLRFISFMLSQLGDAAEHSLLPLKLGGIWWPMACLWRDVQDHFSDEASVEEELSDEAKQRGPVAS